MLPIHENLKGKVAVVTGGGGILCNVMVKELIRHGVKVAILERREEKAKRAADELVALGGEAIGIGCNVLEVESVKQAETYVSEHFGGYDILINGAGGNRPEGGTNHDVFKMEDLGNPDITTLFDVTAEGVNAVLDLNFMGTFIPSQIFSRKMLDREGATIINLSSMSALSPLTRVPAYSAAKAAVSNFTQWLAVYLAETGIRVNAIAPGFFLTDQNRALLTNPDGSLSPRSHKVMAHTPMKRFGKPEDLLGTLIWLIDSQMSGFVTGITVPVDGGFMAYSGV